MTGVVAQPAGERLAQFNSMLQPGSQQLLEQAGLRPGMRVLELGCGKGAMTLWLAQQVGPHGEVTAVDQCADALELLAKRAQQMAISNIRFRHADVEQGIDEFPHVDLVYGRFLLMHLRHSASVLCRLFDATRPGTVFALEEPTISAFRTHADRRLWGFCVDLYRRYCQMSHIDPDYGSRLLKHVSQAGFCVIGDTLNFAPITQAQARRYMALSLSASGERYVDAGLIERATLDGQIAALLRECAEHQPDTHFHAVSQLLAYR